MSKDTLYTYIRIYIYIYIYIYIKLIQEWANVIFDCAVNLLGLNRSPLGFLEKCHTKLCLMTNSEGVIPVKRSVGHLTSLWVNETIVKH